MDLLVEFHSHNFACKQRHRQKDIRDLNAVLSFGTGKVKAKFIWFHLKSIIFFLDNAETFQAACSEIWNHKLHERNVQYNTWPSKKLYG